MSDVSKRAASTEASASQREEEVLAFWNERKIFEKSLNKPARPDDSGPRRNDSVGPGSGGDAPNGDYIFYDGPPFATGTPYYGHYELYRFVR